MDNKMLFKAMCESGTYNTFSDVCESVSRRDQLQDIAERAIKRENEEYLNKIDKRCIEAAEKGLWNCKYRVPTKMISENGFIDILKSSLGVQIKEDESFKHPTETMIVLDWRKF